MTITSFYDTPLEEDVYIFPTSFIQQSLWFIDQLEPQSVAYNMPSSLRLHIPLDIEALERSLNTIVQRHEILRTSFRIVEGQPVQVITPTLTIRLPVLDLRDHPEAEREAEAFRLATEEAKKPFNLAEGPLVRATLLQLDVEEYVLLLNMHHIISDGWSIGVLLQELATLYEAFSHGRPAPLSDLAIQYVDFTVWQREWLQGEMLESQVAYWKQQLKSAPTLELPTDHPRPLVSTSRGSMQVFALSRQLTDALRTLSRQEGASLYMTLLAAFQTLLYRYSGQEDILIGSPIAGRTRVETESLIGSFINTLVLRTDLSGLHAPQTGFPTFRELLRRVRKTTLEAQAHADVPFEYLVKELQPERNLSQHPLFQVLLALETSISTLPSGWTLTYNDINTETSKFDLSIILEDQPEGLAGRFEYSTDLFDESTIARMIGHWQTLLEGIVVNPDQRMTELPLLTEAERYQLLVEWNATQTAYPKDRCIHQLFEDQVERTPDALAVVYGGQRLTYRELNVWANQLAHHLQRLGVAPEVRVGLCMERSLEMVVGFLGILKAGGAYVPLDPSYPKERLAFMLQDTQAPVLLTQELLIEALPTEEVQVICLDTGWKVIAQEHIENPVNGATAKNLAYVMYTSGSTGKPKGVSVTHLAVNRLVFETNYVNLKPSDRIAQASNASFDAATFEIWGALLHGAQLIGISREVILSPRDFATQIREQGISVLFLTTALFNQIASVVPSAFNSVSHLLFGGEAVDPRWVRKVLKHGPPKRLLHVYGPTESTTFTTWYLAEDVPERAKTIPIGRPISNTRLYVLDRHMNAVPIGVPGELYIGGDGLAREYLNRSEITAKSFIPNPFSEDPHARLYKTGDLVRYLPDGAIEFIGRLDHQVKLRGFRIELGEIEAVLGQHPAVREVFVVVRENERGEKSLIAYVVPQRKHKIIVHELRRFLKEHVPEYMVPSDFVLLDALPLNPNGKVDRGALPVPEPTRRRVEETYIAPTQMVHYQLIEIWEELLAVRPIGIRDNFFYLGGHSLLAACLIDKMEQVFKKTIPLATLFAGPTIEQLGNALKQQEDSGSRSPVVPVQTGGSRRPFFYLPGDWNGGAFYCYKLAHDLGPDQPFYVLERYRFDGLRVPPTFEAIAAEHIKSMRTVQPEGPYMLGGFCHGGLEAYEIARQLQASGQAVDLLVLIDPATPAPRKFTRKVISRVGKLLGLGQDKQLNCFLLLRHMYKYLRHKYKYLRNARYRRMLRGSEQFGQAQKFELRRDIYEMGFELPRVDSFIPTSEALREDWPSVYFWVASGYEPGLYAGKTTLFWASKAFPDREKWYEESEMIEMHVIPGTHMSCRTDHLPSLAENLRECISKVQMAEVNQGV